MNRKKLETIILIIGISVVIFFFIFEYLTNEINENFGYVYLIVLVIQGVLLSKCEILLLKYPQKKIELKEEKICTSNTHVYKILDSYLKKIYKLEIENKSNKDIINFYKKKNILSIYTKFVTLIKCVELNDKLVQYLEKQIQNIDEKIKYFDCDFKIIIILEKTNKISEKLLQKNLRIKSKGASLYGIAVNPIIINDGKIYLSGCDPTDINEFTYYNNISFYKKIIKTIKKNIKGKLR